MDRKIRDLQRQAATGDLEARMQLAQAYHRLGPASREDLGISRVKNQ